MKALGIVLIVIGIIGVIYGGISWTTRDTVVDAGPIEITKNKTESIPLPPIAGAVCLVAGTLLVMRKGQA
jgi:hypothetical protein